ncbi:MAG: hypothetical protein K2X48_08565 [Chitinophagaceae bacterium]|nr:hypothetical protein [Chitinophagaceae bacterium]
MNKTTSKPTLLRRILYIVFLLGIIFFFVESLLSIVYFQTYGQTPLATIGLFKKLKRNYLQWKVKEDTNQSQYMVRPGSLKELSKMIDLEMRKANGFDYQPWAGYSAKTFHGQYINVDGFIRKSAPSSSATEGDSNAVVIYFFGGSTMFGFNVADFETIPSYFVKKCIEQKINMPVKVANVGIPTYYSYHELMLFSHLLYNNHRPHIAVFLDGLNDGAGLRATLYRQPFLNYRLKLPFMMDIVRGKPDFRDSLDYALDIPGGSLPQGAADTIFTNYMSAVKAIETIGSAYNVKTCFFIQPVPYYNYTNRKNDPICSQGERPQFQILYPKLETQSFNQNIHFLGNMLEQEKGFPFADAIHYSPAFNEKIAAAVLEIILPEMGKIYAKKQSN